MIDLSTMTERILPGLLAQIELFTSTKLLNETSTQTHQLKLADIVYNASLAY